MSSAVYFRFQLPYDTAMSFAATVLAQLEQLRSADPNTQVFGAQSHGYALNPPLPEAEVQRFEHKHSIELPADFREFLTNVGNGGAGPFYGVCVLGLFDAAGSGDEPWQPNDGIVGVLAEPFPHSDTWNLPDELFDAPGDLKSDEAEEKWQQAHDEKAWAPELMNGAFPICHQGCAFRTYLVVSGPERGHVWSDGRASDEGIAPHVGANGERMTFADWYLDWLRTSLDGRNRSAR